MALMDHGLFEYGEQPARTTDGRYFLLLDGELYNEGDRKRRHCHNLPEQALTTPELCLQLLLMKGEDIVLSFNGLFCLALYDSRDQRLVLISDRYGFRPLYYRARQDSFLFGSELKALFAVDQGSRKIDEVGTAELFCYGTHFRERTWMVDCFRLPPSTILTIRKTALHTRPNSTYQYMQTPPLLNLYTPPTFV